MEEGRREEIGGASSVPITIRLSFIPYTTNDVDDIPLCFSLCAGICPSHPREGGGDSSAALPPQQFPLITDLCAADRPEDRPLNERQSGMMLPPQLLALAFSPAVEESEKGGGKRKELVGSFVATFLLLPPAHLAPLSNCHGLQGHEERE